MPFYVVQPWDRDRYQQATVTSVHDTTATVSGMTWLVIMFVALPVVAAAQVTEPVVVRNPQVSAPVVPTVFNGDLRDLPIVRGWQPDDPEIEIPRRQYPRPGRDRGPAPRASRIDPLLGPQRDAIPAFDSVFTAPVTFPGQGFSGVNPPDTVGDVGSTFYIQLINGLLGTLVVIYNKDGTVASGPFVLDSLGSGSCANGLGDPIVLYDRLAGRWMLSEFATGNNLCVYVSQTSSPISGGWFAYQFTAPGFPDYPKYAVWPDAYYVSTNESNPAGYALDRGQMLTGGAATFQRFVASDLSGFGFQALTPSDIDGATAPPSGAPGYFIRHRDDEAHNAGANNPVQDFLEIWEFHVDFATPGNSTFAGPTSIAIAEIDSDLCGLLSFSCFAQPSGSNPLDPLREVVMWRSQYRNFSTHETLVGNLVTDVTGTDRGGIRWYELRRTGGAWSLFQEGTYSPDGDNRWMGSIAMDGFGNIALGYNVSSSTVFPSIRYTGRQPGDALGTMPQVETTIVAGSASNNSDRFGDYSSMNVDPVDDCTFWFTGEYSPSETWGTQIASLRFASCVVAPTVTSIVPATGSTVGGTAVTLAGDNFVNGAAVSIGGVAATGVMVVDTMTITATTGAHAAGAVDVVVTNLDTHAGTLMGGFTYIASLVFTDDPLIAGTTVIKAVHFNEIRTRTDTQLVRFLGAGSEHTYTNVVAVGGTIQAVDLTDMYAAVNTALAGATPPQSTITVPTITPNVTEAVVSHINDLRDALKVLEALP